MWNPWTAYLRRRWFRRTLARRRAVKRMVATALLDRALVYGRWAVVWCPEPGRHWWLVLRVGCGRVRRAGRHETMAAAVFDALTRAED